MGGRRGGVGTGLVGGLALGRGQGWLRGAGRLAPVGVGIWGGEAGAGPQWRGPGNACVVAAPVWQRPVGRTGGLLGCRGAGGPRWGGRISSRGFGEPGLGRDRHGLDDPVVAFGFQFECQLAVAGLDDASVH